MASLPWPTQTRAWKLESEGGTLSIFPFKPVTHMYGPSLGGSGDLVWACVRLRGRVSLGGVWG